jgi:hypothetical protein
MNFYNISLLTGNLVTSVNIVSDYRLDDQNWIPDRGKFFFLQALRSDQLWSLPSLLSNGYRGSFPEGKGRSGRDADHSPHLVPK